MQRILVATDFSARSDRALRRAVLLARQTGAILSLVHVVDDDQPAAIVEVEREAAGRLLDELARTLVEVDGVTADARIVLATPSEGVVDAAEAVAADLVVVGVPRPQMLRDVFVGTTVERIIRAGRRPTLMARGVPTGLYRQILVATDFSEGSGRALRAVAHLGLDRVAAVTVAHAFEAVMPTLHQRDGAIREQAQAWLAEERGKSDRALAEFLAPFALALPRRLVLLNEGSEAETLVAAARADSVDLIVIGTRGLSALGGRLLGSVTTELLRSAPVDVLVVPAAADPAAAG
jgi:nucleotide-binding universal stress UspA family protein